MAFTPSGTVGPATVTLNVATGVGAMPAVDANNVSTEVANNNGVAAWVQFGQPSVNLTAAVFVPAGQTVIVTGPEASIAATATTVAIQSENDVASLTFTRGTVS